MIMRKIDQDLIKDAQNVYMIGIGGVGMSALARVLSHRGLEVRGSDSKETHRTRSLNEEGISVEIQPREVSFDETDLVIYSSAIDSSHFELQAAHASGARIHHRAEILASLLNGARTSVAVTGTHGKTTVSSMISLILSQIGKEPTCLIGGEVLNFKSNTLLGKSDLWISEVDESDQTHELYAPHYAIVTNLEEDHMDHYEDRKELESSFENFFSNLSKPGMIVFNQDDTKLKEMVLSSGKPYVSFGLNLDADFSAQNIEQKDFGVEFDLFEVGLYAARVQLPVPGIHNVTNALAAIALLIQLGIDLEEVCQALQGFRGAKRRLEVIEQTEDLRIIDDYAHHPTEIRASIEAMMGANEPITVIFQPHRYSRTKHFVKEFAQAFQGADQVFLTDIYGAGEKNTGEIDVECLFEEMKKNGHSNMGIMGRDQILTQLMKRKNKGIVAFLGAGDIGDIAYEFASRLKSLPAV